MDQETTIAPATNAEPEGDVGIKEFLEGWNPKKGVVAIETFYNKSHVDVVVHDPETGEKKVEKHSFRPFCYIKDFRTAGVSLYGGSKEARMKAMSKHGIEIKPLRTHDNNGATNDRLDSGYKFLVSTNSEKGYQAISNFFREGGVDMYGKRQKKALFRPANPGTPNPSDLYTLMEERQEASFLYNNVLKRFEIHINDNNVSRYVDNHDDDVSFIRVKTESDELEEGVDYTITYNEDHNKFVLAFTPEVPPLSAEELAKTLKTGVTAEKSRAVLAEYETQYGTETLAGWYPFLSHNMSDKFDMGSLVVCENESELIAIRREDKQWLKKDDTRYKSIQRAWAKYETHKQRLAQEIEKAKAKLIVVKSVRDYKKLQVSYRESYSDLFFTLKREEQFMIQSGIRLFKGYENYSEVHKFIFDIETTGLYADKGDRIFMIGCKDNRGLEELLAIRPGKDIEDEERRLIAQLFHLFRKLKPAIIYGYNSENFDFDFILKRARILGMIVPKFDRDGKAIESTEILGVPTTLIDGIHWKRREGATVKYGGESEEYTQTLMHGYTVLDIIHAVRRTQAINSDLKEAGLKYVCKFEGIAKENRVYIPGNKIYPIWAENKWFAVHPTGTGYKQLETIYQDGFTKNEKGPTDYEWKGVHRDNIYCYGDETRFVQGSELVKQYLIDDLWETEQVDGRYNEDRFLVGKLLPTFFSRTCTMGGAAVWNLIMTAWSYEKGLAIPSRLKPQTFTGGLSRTFTLGKFKNVFKFDFSGLYPSLQLEHNIFPKHDVTGVLKRLLLYFKTTRDVFKALANDESLPENERKVYKAKQLPLKILNNSNFGANGSTFFNWSDFTCAERITCLGRLYLRNMIQFFMVYGCKPTVCDTDGINMEVPEMVMIDINGNPLREAVSIETYSYTNKKGKTKTGADALVEKYNEEILNSPYMKLDNDGMWPTAINISRKNYANMEADGKIKYVGNTLKDKTMPEYVKEFVDKSVRLLLEDKGDEFIKYYYKYLTDIYTMQIPLKKIANKAKVKQRPEEYAAAIASTTGKKKSKQAHMELIIQDNLSVNLGDVVYYVSTGIRKSHGYSKVDKQGKVMAMLVTAAEMEADPEKKGNYNVAKYVDVFNNKVESLLVAFKPEVRYTLLKEDPTKQEVYSHDEMQLIQLKNPEPKDDIDTFFVLEPSEVAFWNRTGLNPKEILQDFTTSTPYYGYEYVEKLEKVRERLKEKNVHVYSQHDYYTNGSLVLTFTDSAHITNTEDGETESVPQELVKFFHMDTLPTTNEDYQRVESLKYRYGQHTDIRAGRDYTLCVVENGYLNTLKKL